MTLTRVFFGILLAINLAALGFTVAVWASTTYLVPVPDGAPPPEGLTGSALVMACGAGAALVGLMAGAVLVWKLRAERLLPVTLTALVASGVAIGLIVWRAGR